MNKDNENMPKRWPLEVKYQLLDKSKTDAVVMLKPGITTLVGPNGSGKTRALRAIHNRLETSGLIHNTNRKVHFLAAGRTSPLEHFRASANSPHGITHDDAYVGHKNYQPNWWKYESITGILLAMEDRTDLQLKVEARLQQLFDRSVELSWSQSGLNIKISPVSGGASYAANHEASGILQLVALLAAIHNNEIGVLVIDEPEISLHPQHQAFLLEEMERVAGDPSDPTKKLIVIATHSATLLPLRKISELPAILFFNSVYRPPVQIPDNSEILNRGKLASLIMRLSTTHRMAAFAERVLLVEGTSDEIIAVQLSVRMGFRLLARNAQILPVTGKGEFIETAKLFSLLNKKVAVLADLDALADESRLVKYFSDLPEGIAVASKLGRTTLADLDKDLRNNLTSFMDNHKVAIKESISDYRDWSSRESSSVSPRRVTLARLLTDPKSFGHDATIAAENLANRYHALLDALEKLGCFFLRRGAIENYYQVATTAQGKIDFAAEEVKSFEEKNVEYLKTNYKDVLIALSHIAANQRIDEDQLLRPKLAAILAAAFSGLHYKDSDAKLNSQAKKIVGPAAEVFKLINRSNENDLRIEVQLASPLFLRNTFPFEISIQDHIHSVIQAKLPGEIEM